MKNTAKKIERIKHTGAALNPQWKQGNRPIHIKKIICFSAHKTTKESEFRCVIYFVKIIHGFRLNPDPLNVLIEGGWSGY